MAAFVLASMASSLAAFSPRQRIRIRADTSLFQAHGASYDAPSFHEYLEQRRQRATGEQATVDRPAASPTNNGQAQTYGHNIGRLLLQRSIQTQLYYLADLRDEPTYMWLREFLGHDHLDDKGRFNELDGLHAEGGWRGYLAELEGAPPKTITVQLAPPRLSAQQMRNPYLAAQAVGRTYEETIDPAKISRTIRAVARSLEREWADDLAELAAEDRERVAHHFEREGIPYIQTAADAARDYWLKRQVVAGGEGDDQGTPLHKLNSRIVARFCTRAAFRRVVDELQHGDCDVQRSAGQWLLTFSNEWVPKLQRGADDDVRRGLGTPPPGQWQRLCSGADANDATEALWQELPQSFTDGSDEALRLYSPEALAARVRKARADICDEVADELRSIVAFDL